MQQRYTPRLYDIYAPGADSLLDLQQAIELPNIATIEDTRLNTVRIYPSLEPQQNNEAVELLNTDIEDTSLYISNDSTVVVRQRQCAVNSKLRTGIITVAGASICIGVIALVVFAGTGLSGLCPPDDTSNFNYQSSPWDPRRAIVNTYDSSTERNCTTWGEKAESPTFIITLSIGIILTCLGCVARLGVAQCASRE